MGILFDSGKTCFESCGEFVIFMKIIPAVNEVDFSKIKEKIEKAAEFFPSAEGWIQIDIADGKFTSHKTWNNPRALRELRIQNSELRKLNLEIHLMVENPQDVVDDWIGAGAKRIIVHHEAVVDFAKK